MHEFFGQSVTGSGGLHAIGFPLPLDWAADRAAREEMERKVIAFISLLTRLFELREQGDVASPQDPLYETALQQLANDAGKHWPINERPAVIALFVQRFAAE